MTSDRVVSILLSILLLTSAVAGVEIISEAGDISTGSGIVSATSHTVIVDDDGSGITTIQEGINQASDGNTVVVKAGTYNETVIVNKSVSVVTNEGAVLDGGGRVGNAFLVANKSRSLSNVTIEGFEITNYSSDSIFNGQAISIRNTSVTNVTVHNNSIHDIGGHGIVLLSLGETQRDVRISNNSLENTGLGGIVVVNDGGTQSSVTIRENSVTNVSWSGLNVWARGGGATSDVLVENVSFSDGQIGVNVNITQSASLDGLELRRVVSEDNGYTGFILNVTASATVSPISVRESLFQNNSHSGIVVTQFTPAGVLDVHRSIIRNNTRGVDNNNATGLVDARYNYWGDSTGAGSEDPNDPVEDPVTGKLAGGSGDTVSKNGTTGVSNVRFSPSICGKTSSDSQRIKPDFGQTTTDTIAGETITVDASNCVGIWLWDRSIIPFRTDHNDADTKILLPETFISVEGAGDVSMNRNYFTIYQVGQSVTLNFDKVTGIETQRFAGEEVQLVVFYVEGNVNTNQSLENLLNASVDSTTGNITVDADGVSVVETRDIGTLDGTGEITTSFTPQKSGDYIATLATIETGDGFEDTGDGNVSFNVLNDSSTIIGVEQIIVHRKSSSVTPNKTQVVQGNDVSFEADSGLSATSISHFVLAYNRTKFVDKTLIVNDTNITSSASGVIFTIKGTSDGESFFLEVHVTDDGVVEDVTTGGALSDIDAKTAFVAGGGATETLDLTLGTAGTIPEDASTQYQFLHLAFNEADPSIRSSSAGTVQVTGPRVTVVDATLSRNSINQGQSINVTATLENPGTSPATDTIRVFFNGTEVHNETVTLDAGKTTTKNFTVRFATTGTFDVTVEDLFAGTLTVQAAPSDGGGGGGGGGGREEPTVSFRVVNTGSGQSIIVRDALTGSNFDVPVNLAGAGVTITNIGIDQRFQDPKYTVQIQHPQANPPSGTRTLDKGQGIAYFQISRLDIKNVNIRSVTFTFTIDPAALPEGASPEDVQMYRFRGGQWRELETTHLSGNRYQAVSPGFSVFAVGTAPAEQTPTATPTATPAEPPTETPTPTTDETPPQSPGTTSPSGTPFLQTLLLGMLVGFLLIALILIGGYYAYQEGYLDEYLERR